MTEEVKTKDQLLAELRTAMDAGDMKTVSRIAKSIAEFDAVAAKAEKDAKLEALKGITIAVKEAIDKVVQKFYDKGDLDVAEGVWYSQDFGENLTTCKLIKRQSTGGGGGTHAGKGRNFASTAELLKEHGEEAANDEGQTWNELYEAAKGDGNKVYQVRMRLAKALKIV